MTRPRRPRVLLCVGGGIAAYKSALVVRELLRADVEVRVAMTDAATRFVGPLTFTGLTGSAPVLDMFDPSYAGEVHVELAAWADAIVVAPATADLLAKMAAGLAGDVVLATLLCRRGPVLLAPAMHTRMWESPTNTANLARLEAFPGVRVIGPITGPLASGEVGMGRMAEPEDIATATLLLLGRTSATPARDLVGVRVLVTAGPTYEDIDPVRFIGNRSSGKMGFAVAERASARGAHVVLVVGPATARMPEVASIVRVRSALEMNDAVREHADASDVVVMAAAVADYRPRTRHDTKLKKPATHAKPSDPASADDELGIALVRNPDILAGLGHARGSASRPVLVGFAVDSGDLVPYARDKLVRKKVDLVVANRADIAFEGDESEVVLVDATSEHPVGPAQKTLIADAILDRIA
ncbi:MAG: bifunctional phosphopantothenoylcysteine decarboxylase/phosphopantothenate--cysteine ligase CoaBC, partial [Deltaproteobacteria bacterium]|nr:bifunctional phosphopantothenoylcysteine decarboxylase/phosphopantothenate--cysteine ligase CoaBC [Deltaproteobacteria bacterium]